MLLILLQESAAVVGWLVGCAGQLTLKIFIKVWFDIELLAIFKFVFLIKMIKRYLDPDKAITTKYITESMLVLLDPLYAHLVSIIIPISLKYCALDWNTVM